MLGNYSLIELIFSPNHNNSEKKAELSKGNAVSILGDPVQMKTVIFPTLTRRQNSELFNSEETSTAVAMLPIAPLMTWNCTIRPNDFSFLSFVPRLHLMVCSK